MVPRVFDWPNIFHETECFPKLTAWNQLLREDPIFAGVHKEIWDFWQLKWEEGQFTSIIPETEDTSFKWKYP